MAISKIIYKANAQDTGTVWMDATSATAAAADITAPKTAMLADGVMTTGTGSGGGGGLEYETGTYTPVSDVAEPTISFANTHDTKPCLVLFADTTSAAQTVNYSEMMLLYGSVYEAFGSTANSGSRSYYSIYRCAYRGTSSSSLSTTGTVDNTDSTSQVSSTRVKPSSGTSNYFRAGRTYKWIAVWAPST